MPQMTPVLDRLAASGVCFDNAFCQSPVCTPSRMSFLTGKHISTLGVWNNHWPLAARHKTLAQHFVEAGYATCLVGKMHFGGTDQMHGFQHRPYGDLRHGLGHQSDPIDMFPNSGGVTHAGASEIPESLQQDVVVTASANCSGALTGVERWKIRLLSISLITAISMQRAGCKPILME